MKEETKQIMNEIDSSFDKLLEQKDSEHIAIIMHGDDSKINLMIAAPSMPVALFTMVSSVANQMIKINNPDLSQHLIITLIGMLGIEPDDKFVVKMRDEIQTGKDRALAAAVEQATIELPK